MSTLLLGMPLQLALVPAETPELAETTGETRGEENEVKVVWKEFISICILISLNSAVSVRSTFNLD